jgi:hypothetical protein
MYASKSKLLENEGEGWTCLRCGQLIKSIEPYIDIDPKAIVVKDLQPDEDDNINDEKKGNSDDSKEAQKPNKQEKEPSPEPSESEEDDDDEEDEDEYDDDDNQQSGFVVEDF